MLEAYEYMRYTLHKARLAEAYVEALRHTELYVDYKIMQQAKIRSRQEGINMKIVVLDGYTENPGDLSWSELEKLGSVTAYDRTAYAESPLIAERIGDAEIVVMNKTPISRETIDKCPNIKLIAVLATGYNVVDYNYAREKGIALDFNPTYFSHPMLRDNWTLASPEKEVRDFWVQHGIACRKIGEYFGRELGEVCITNHWIPDGSKDTRVDTLGPRERLVESLDRIFAEPIDRKYNRDSIEGKVFGLGLESYTAGSHEFYTNYALTTGKAMVCMDTGHYHPTESVAAKLSSYFVFGQEIMTHLSRAVRWDSDHVATVSEDTVAIMQEIKRCNAFDKVHLGLDFFDASIDRVSASVIGARSVKKALMIALLEPTDKLMEAEREGNFTRRLALLEEFKMLPAGIVFDEYCRRHDMPGADWAAKL